MKPEIAPAPAVAWAQTAQADSAASADTRILNLMNLNLSDKDLMFLLEVFSACRVTAKKGYTLHLSTLNS
jgi:hypothetical protein